jgi:hypothetical protein
MKREQIIGILKSYADYHYLPEIEKTAYVIGDHSFKDISDAILALPIDVPSEEEIEITQMHYEQTEWDNRDVIYCYRDFMEGAKWAINEIIKRNK